MDFLLEHKQGSGEGYREMILGMGFVHLPHDDNAQPLRHLLEEGEWLQEVPASHALSPWAGGLDGCPLRISHDPPFPPNG